MLAKTFVILACALAFLSCEKPPDYGLTPYIKFDNIVKTLVNDSSTQSFEEKVIISVKFQDGDGDLGVSTNDVSNIKYRAYSDTSVSQNGDTSYKFINYRAKIFRKEAGQYIPGKTIIRLGGTFSELIKYSEIGPIDGVLDYGFGFSFEEAQGLGYKRNDTIRFEVYLIDRALHISNTITTDSIVMFQN